MLMTDESFRDYPEEVSERGGSRRRLQRKVLSISGQFRTAPCHRNMPQGATETDTGDGETPVT